jgi:RNA polymerase sigma-70 factor (ECF subfamily)
MIDNSCFSQYAEKYMDMVFRLAFSYLKCRADADDVTQNTLCKLYLAGKAFSSEDHVRHWLIRVAINECKKQFISPWRRTESIEDFAQALSFTTPEHSELFYSVMALPKKYRVAIYLYYYEDYSTDEIARLLGIPSATVRTQLSRGRSLLKNNLMEAEGYV